MRYSGIKINFENSENVLFENAVKIEEILRFAVRQALISHKQQNNPVAVWKDGKAVLIPAEDIEVENI